jgi:FkbM family methyltransferase
MLAAETLAPVAESEPRVARRSRGVSLPIVSGPLRGYWWQSGSGGKIARLLLGTYEREQTRAFQQRVAAGQQLLDIGAAAGYYSLLAAKLVGNNGSVLAFEPDSTNLEYLRRHVSQNRLKNVQVLPVALDNRSGHASFGGGTGTGTRRLCAEGGHTVLVRRLDDVARQQGLTPQHLKIDVEGAELGVLQGGEQVIRSCRPTIFLSTHDWIQPGVHAACCELLSAWGYQLEPMIGADLQSTSELLCTVA